MNTQRVSSPRRSGWLAAGVLMVVLSGAVVGVGRAAGKPSPSADKSPPAAPRNLSPNAVPGVPAFRYGRPYPFSDQWVNWPWNASDKRYLDAEARVQNDLKHRDPGQVAASYQRNAQAHPSEPLAQFQWAFAAQSDSQLVPKDRFTFGPALQALQGINPGNVRAYSRLQYLMTLMLEPNKTHPEIERVGDRVLEINPADWYVRRQMVFDLCNGKNIQKAVRVASAWAANDPNNPMVHSTLAFVYQNLWFRDKSAATKTKAIGEYQRFIALAPPTDPFRARAAYLVRVLQKQKT